MAVLGKYLLALLSAILCLATPLGDFNSRHVFHPAWPAHARFHNAAYALGNFGTGALCLWLLFLSSPDHFPFVYGIVTFLLGWSGLVLVLAGFVPGASNVADREPIWHGHPISAWFTFAFLALTAIGGALALS